MLKVWWHSATIILVALAGIQQSFACESIPSSKSQPDPTLLPHLDCPSNAIRLEFGSVPYGLKIPISAKQALLAANQALAKGYPLMPPEGSADVVRERITTKQLRKIRVELLAPKSSRSPMWLVSYWGAEISVFMSIPVDGFNPPSGSPWSITAIQIDPYTGKAVDMTTLLEATWYSPQRSF